MLTELKMTPCDCISAINIHPPVLNEAPVERFGINKDEATRTLLEFMEIFAPGGLCYRSLKKITGRPRRAQFKEQLPNVYLKSTACYMFA